MAKRRKTKQEKRQEWLDAERRVWQDFRVKLAALNSVDEAKSLVSEAPTA